MSEKELRPPLGRPKDSTSNETLRRAEAASGIGAFEFDLLSKRWVWTPQVAVLFGLDPQTAPSQFHEWLSTVFPDDALKIRSALEISKSSGSFYVEFRVKGHDGRLHWLAGKGRWIPILTPAQGYYTARITTSMNASNSKQGSCPSMKRWRPESRSCGRKRTPWKCLTGPESRLALSLI